MLELFLSIPLTLLILLACHEAGRSILWLLKIEDPLGNSIDNSLLRFASGYIGISFILSLFGHFNIFRSWAMWVVLVFFCVSAFVCPVRRQALKETWDGIISFGRGASGVILNRILLIVMLLALGWLQIERNL